VRSAGVRLRRKLALLVLVLLVLVGLAFAWSWSPMREWLDVDGVVDAIRQAGESFGPAAAVAGLTLALVLAVPLIFLTLVAVAAYGPLTGSVYVLAGALMSAAVSYGVGRLLGREVVERLAGPRVNQLSRRLARRGLLAVVAVRLVPVAPFAVVNMVAGASHLRLQHLLLGTAIGILPGTLGVALFLDQIQAALRSPTPWTWALVALTVGLIAGGAWGLRRWMRRVE
jgi:uncharacterized membrane protein YdjX (TVP38/TMEM64 family)